MLFAMLIYEKPSDFARRDSSGDGAAYVGAWRKYHAAIVEAGIFVSGSALDVPETATTVRMRDSKRQIQDGPYASAKEQLGGFTLLELPSLDAALEWAARSPAAAYGAVEVRPLASELDQHIQR
ncbi:MAG: YciI family protein [bacterium]